MRNEENRKLWRFSELEHHHDNLVTSLYYALVDKSIIYVATRWAESTHQRVVLQQTIETQHVEHRNHPRKTSEFFLGVMLHTRKKFGYLFKFSITKVSVCNCVSLIINLLFAAICGSCGTLLLLIFWSATTSTNTVYRSRIRRPYRNANWATLFLERQWVVYSYFKWNSC